MTHIALNINPHEGKPRGWVAFSAVALIGTALLPLPAYVSFVGYALFGILFLSTGLLVLGRTISLSKGKWARIHYPLMVRLAAVLGYMDSNPAYSTADDLTLKNNPAQHASRLLLRNALGDDEELVDQIWSSASKRMKNFSDKEIIKKYMLEQNPSITGVQLQAVLDEAQDMLVLDNVKMIIAELVATQYGEDERNKYVVAIMTGKAN